jgi:hypothetical protein
MPFDVHPALDIAQAGPQVVIEARVAADPPRPLHWRLAVETRGPGGSSRSTQAGDTDGASAAPLSSVRVNAGGIAELHVFSGGRLVAQHREEFDAPSPSKTAE